MFTKYFEITSCYERENKETKDKEIVIIGNELRWKWVISSFSRFFVLTPEKFVEKFRNHIKENERNLWLTRLKLAVDTDYIYDPNKIVSDNELPDTLK